MVASLAGDVEVEEAAEYLFEHGIVAYPYTTEKPVAVLGAKYQWARGAGCFEHSIGNAIRVRRGLEVVVILKKRGDRRLMRRWFAGECVRKEAACIVDFRIRSGRISILEES